MQLREILFIVQKKFLKSELVIFPSLKEKEALDQILYKSSFMFPDRKIFYCGLNKSQAIKPSYLGNIQLSESIYQVSFVKLLILILSFRIVLIWKCPFPFIKKLRHALPVFDIDYKRNRMEGWHYFFAYNSSQKKTRAAIFDFKTFPPQKNCYAFGTGESLNSAYDHQFNEGHKIICNSMIKNIPLMKHINPDFLVFADAIYHFGPSIYAFTFRKALVEFVKKFPDTHILIPEDFYHHFMKTNHQFKGQVFAIPKCKHKKINIDLRKEYGYHNYYNILNLLILPIASTIAENIYFLGFDGRSKDSKRFWNYSKENNFTELLTLQEQAHPGFFKNFDYQSHADKINRQTEIILQTGENIGKSYFSLSKSTNNSLKKRYNIKKDNK